MTTTSRAARRRMRKAQAVEARRQADDLPRLISVRHDEALAGRPMPAKRTAVLRLFARGKIDRIELHAAESYAADQRAHLDLEMELCLARALGERDQLTPRMRRHCAALWRHREAKDAMTLALGRKAAATVDRVLIDDLHCRAAMLATVRRGLAILIDHYRLNEKEIA